MQRQIDDRTIARNRNDPQHRRRRAATFEKDTAAKLLNGVRLEPAFQNRAIHFVDAETRVCERVRKIAVIGQQQHARRVVIQPSDGHETCRFRTALRAHQILNCAPAFRIAHRGDDSDGFVQHEHFALRHDDRATVELDAIAVFNARAELAHELAVHANFSGYDQLFGRAT